MLLCHRRVAVLGLRPSLRSARVEAIPTASVKVAATGAATTVRAAAAASSSSPSSSSAAASGKAENLPVWLLQGTKRLEQRALKENAKHRIGTPTSTAPAAGASASTGAGSYGAGGSRLAAHAERMLLGVGGAPTGSDVAAVSAPVVVTKAGKAAAFKAGVAAAAAAAAAASSAPSSSASSRQGEGRDGSGSVYRQRQMDALLQRIEDGRAAAATGSGKSVKSTPTPSTPSSSTNAAANTGAYRFGDSSSNSDGRASTAFSASPSTHNAVERRVAAERESTLLRQRIAELSHAGTPTPGGGAAAGKAASPTSQQGKQGAGKQPPGAAAAGGVKVEMVTDDELRNLLLRRRRRLSKKKKKRSQRDGRASLAELSATDQPNPAATSQRDGQTTAAAPLPQVVRNPKRLDPETERATRMAVRSLLRYHFAQEHYDLAQRSERDRQERAALVASFAARQRAEAREQQDGSGDIAEHIAPPFSSTTVAAYEPGTPIAPTGGPAF